MQKVGFIAGLTAAAKLVMSKGVFGLIRFKSDGSNTSLETHLDWDREGYDEAVKLVKNIKRNEKKDTE